MEHALLDEDTTGMEPAKMLNGCLSLSLSIVCFFAHQICQGERSRHSRDGGMDGFDICLAFPAFTEQLLRQPNNDNGSLHPASDGQREQHRSRTVGGCVTSRAGELSLSGVVYFISFRFTRNASLALGSGTLEVRDGSGTKGLGRRNFSLAGT